MSNYLELKNRINRGEVVILDGAIGTELQEMGAPMGGGFWCGRTVDNSPDIVWQLHADYIAAGADIITTNTFDTVPLKMWAEGLIDEAQEWNVKAARLAVEARDHLNASRPVVVAGALGPNSNGTENEIERSFRNQAQYLAEGGADMLLVEMIGNRREPRIIAVEAALETGLPTWVVFSSRVSDNGEVLLGHPLHSTDPRREDSPQHSDPTLAEAIDDVKSLGCDAALIFHSEVEHTPAAVKVLRDIWEGPIGAYPHRGDFKMPEWLFENRISPSEFVDAARTWVDSGAQIIGGCCGIGREHIRLLKEQIPSHLAM